MGIQGNNGERGLGAATQFMRGVLLLINVLFILASIAGIVASILILKGDDQSYFRFCSVCSKFSIVLIITFSSLLFVSLLGFCALAKRQNCLLTLYALLLSLFFIVALATSVVIVLVHEGEFDSELSDAWNAAVSGDANGICDLQAQVGCSGWNNFCGVNATNSCPDCSANPGQVAKILAANETCKTLLRSDVNHYFIILIGTGFGLAFLSLVSIFTSCSVRRSYAEYSELYEKF